MKRLSLIGFFAASVLVTAAPVEQSLSTSRQFIVYGTDLAMRGAICDLAERTKCELRTLLEQPDDWTTPIVINAQYPQANVPELPQLSVEVGQTGFGLKLQLDLVMNADTTRPEIRRELLRALMLERMYRVHANIAAGTTYRSPPDWLLDGIPAEQSDWARDRIANLLALPTHGKNFLPLEKFLAQRPELLDDAGRTLYRAYSFALVNLLRRSSDGACRLTQFISDLPVASNDSIAELRNHFPGLFGSDGQAAKTWEQQIAHFSSEKPYELMGPAETERALVAFLRIPISEGGVEKSYEIEQFPVYLKSKSVKHVLEALAHRLAALGTRSNPLYAPVIAEYAEITARILRGRTLGVGQRLERLRNFRADLIAKINQIDDYLNWFEATNLPRLSGEFGEYMRAADRASQPNRTRRDPISVYLTSIEAQFDER